MKLSLALSLGALARLAAADVLFPFPAQFHAPADAFTAPQRVLADTSAAGHPQSVPEGDPAGRPNAATRLEVTSAPGATVPCGRSNDAFTAGYAHFTNQLGVEDKHMFWWYFPARNDPENAPVVLTLGGGPGSSGMLFPFSGAGPCIITDGEDGKGALEPSPYSWTEHANLLAIDHPVGVGFSYADEGSLRNSSARAAWDVDDFLQELWKTYPSLVKNQFVLHSGSYGGTFMPHIVNTMRTRNLAAAESGAARFQKMPESLMLVNPASDWAAIARWFLETSCYDFGLFNTTMCHGVLDRQIPPCLDAIELVTAQHSPATSLAALSACYSLLDFSGTAKDPYDTRKECENPPCISTIGLLGHFLNNETYKDALGIPDGVTFAAMSQEIGNAFIQSGDFLQPAPAKLLGPAIDDGMRLLVYNGMYDAVCPWRANLAWMRLLDTKHQKEFRNATEVDYPGVGSVLQAATGAGSFTMLKIREAGHMVILSQPALLQHMSKKWMANEPFF